MIFEPADHLACPLDGGALSLVDRQYRCPHGHGFDLARQGYVNLLPVQHKHSREPGDSKAMVAARGRFLDAGFYRPIAQMLNAVALSRLPQAQAVRVVDAGCGEGYYLDGFARALAASGWTGQARLAGFDIAKPAVQAATRRNRAVTWFVASSRNPCLLPGTVDLLFCLFGFPDFEAFARVLRPGGSLLLVDAAEDHLLELREVIYPQVRRSPPPSVDKAQPFGFEPVENRPLRFRTPALARERIGDLLLMTPHLYRATRAGKEAAAALEALALTVDVVLRVLVRC